MFRFGLYDPAIWMERVSQDTVFYRNPAFYFPPAPQILSGKDCSQVENLREEVVTVCFLLSASIVRPSFRDLPPWGAYRPTSSTITSGSGRRVRVCRIIPDRQEYGVVFFGQLFYDGAQAVALRAPMGIMFLPHTNGKDERLGQDDPYLGILSPGAVEDVSVVRFEPGGIDFLRARPSCCKRPADR